MALEEYRRKRRFQDTPEPEGEVDATAGQRFVVQKHKASHLHYDFRLEMDGVLKSWAVPKGPSMDPADKRLAMMVEDHPVSYFHFEGIIPEGNYGAGTVMVWDTGVWQALGDAHEMLAKGDLKFVLLGEKLKGEFVLAHIKARRPGSKGTEWLLIKKKDPYIEEKYNIDAYDESVLTHRSLGEIALDKGAAQWQSNTKAAPGGKKKNAWLAESIAKTKAKAKPAQVSTPEQKTAGKTGRTKKNAGDASTKTRSAKPSKESDPPVPISPETIAGIDLSHIPGARIAAMPKFIQPMLALFADEPFEDPAWLYEIKWDGYRALAFLKNSRVRLFSRSENEMTADYPEIAEKLPLLVTAESAILDGEICALDESGRASFGLMQQHSKQPASIPILYYVFDLLHLNGYSLLQVELEHRKRLLEQLLKQDPLVRYSGHFDQGLALYEAARQRGLEGIVAKRRASQYVAKRSRDWLKIKLTQRQEFVIGGYAEAKGSRPYFGSLALGLYDAEGRLIPVGQVGTGFTDETLADLWQQIQPLEIQHSPFHGKVESDRKVHYLQPKLVAEVKFIQWTHESEGGGLKLRAPVFEGLRFDKKPEECVFETEIDGQ